MGWNLAFPLQPAFQSLISIVCTRFVLRGTQYDFYRLDFQDTMHEVMCLQASCSCFFIVRKEISHDENDETKLEMSSSSKHDSHILESDTSLVGHENGC